MMTSPTTTVVRQWTNSWPTYGAISQHETNVVVTLTHAQKSHDPTHPEVRQGHFRGARSH